MDDYYVDHTVDLDNPEVQADLDGLGLVLIKRVRLDELIQKAQTTERMIDQERNARIADNQALRKFIEWDQKLTKARNEAKLLREQLVAAQAELARVQASNNDMNAKLVKMREGLAMRQSLDKETSAALVELRNVATDLVTELNSARGNAKVAEGSLKYAYKKLEEMRQELVDARAERDALQAKVSALQEEPTGVGFNCPRCGKASLISIKGLCAQCATEELERLQTEWTLSAGRKCKE